MDVRGTPNIILGEGHVMHARPAPAKGNAFSYPIFNFVIPVHEIDACSIRPLPPIFRIESSDYLDGQTGSFREKIKSFLQDRLNYSCDQIWLQTIPRMWGYVFNPVSFWFCHKNGRLNAVLCEVNNTFGDRHFYFLDQLDQPVEGAKRLAKKFHVSPFFDIQGEYEFEFLKNDEISDIRIKLMDRSELKLDTRIRLQLKPLKETSGFHLAAKYGWLTVLIMIRIHLQAVKLWRKGFRFFHRPEPPFNSLTTSRK